ncbi:hypothetical protein BDZ45DRAFT_808626 [Acephala macrosclerotiorum]|nr:hypothetical protein BDZ45DRAFT_808626 [Acephala macrosclerotiorum]
MSYSHDSRIVLPPPSSAVSFSWVATIDQVAPKFTTKMMSTDSHVSQAATFAPAPASPDISELLAQLSGLAAQTQDNSGAPTTTITSTPAVNNKDVSALLAELSSLAAQTQDDSGVPTSALTSPSAVSSLVLRSKLLVHRRFQAVTTGAAYNAACSSFFQHGISSTAAATTTSALPPSTASLSPLFKIYMIPFQFTPFQYAFPFNQRGPPAYLDSNGNAVLSQSFAGTFALVLPNGYLVSVNPATKLSYASNASYFADTTDDLNDDTSTDYLEFKKFLDDAESLDAYGSWNHLGNGFLDGLGQPGTKLQLSNSGLANGVARYCATMNPTGRGNGQSFEAQRPVQVGGYTGDFVGDSVEGFLYAQAVSGSLGRAIPSIVAPTAATSATPALPKLGLPGLGG